MMTKYRSSAVAMVVALVAAAGLGACGDDDDNAAPADETTAPAADSTAAPVDTTAAPVDTTAAPVETTAAPVETTAAPVATTSPTTGGGTASAEFCEAFVAIDKAMANVPENPAQIGDYIATEVTPNVETIRANLPDEVADQVTVMVDAVETAASTGDFSVFETEAFGAASGAVYPFLEDGCGLPAVKALARDFSYGGVPEELDAGVTLFVLTNDSEAGELHELGLVKLKDGVDVPLDELLAMPEKQADKLIDRFAAGIFVPPGATNGTTVELTPGRWVYACFIPVGSVGGKEGKGKPHFMEGMAGEFIVT